MQYLAWIQSASQHLLVSNLFVLHATPSDYFQPSVAISGALVALGVAPWLTLLLWKPVAVVGVFFAIRAYAYRSVEGRNAHRAVIALGLFFGSATFVHCSWGIVGDMMLGWLSWGYTFGVMAVALLVFSLLSYDRARGADRVSWTPGLLGALASILHPWQGEMLIMLVVVAELIRWREHGGGRGLALPTLTVTLTGLPCLYYLLLAHFDTSWALAQVAARHEFSFSAIAIGVAPLAVIAALGYRGRPRNFLELMTRVWLPAATLIYVLSAAGLGATPLHAFNGITAPLAALAVLGVQRTGWERMPRARLVSFVAVAVATIPANADALATARNYARPRSGNANFITRHERAALAFLQHDPHQGSVMTQFYLAEAVPARTGRHTRLGDCLWSVPHCLPLSRATDMLFRGTMSRAQARTFVRRSGARFLLASCQPHANLQRLLGSTAIAVHRFGCVDVYDLGPAGEGQESVAKLPLRR
jgi:hypothetical protein